MSTPDVSVLLPVWNGQRHLAATLESLLAQTWQSLEVVAVDDGSTDGSLALLESFAARDPRLRVLSHQVNRGVSATRNSCLDASQGKFLAFSAQDDVSVPGRFERQLRFLRENPTFGFVGSAIRLMDGADAPLGENSLPLSDFAMRWTALLDAPARHSTLFVRAELMRGPDGVRYDESVRMNSDYDIVCRLLDRAPGLNLPEPLVTYRMHETNHSRVRRDDYLASGTAFALRQIRREFPAWEITLDDVAALRGALLGLRHTERPFPLARMKHGLDLALELRERFQLLHPAQPAPVSSPCHLPHPIS